MTLPLLYLPPAKADARAAYLWLEEARTGYGAIFLEELHAMEKRIRENPEMYQTFRGQCRRAVLHLFDYAVVYRVSPKAIEVIGVLHFRMSPSVGIQRASPDPK